MGRSPLLTPKPEVCAALKPAARSFFPVSHASHPLQGTEVEMEQPRLKLVHIWDAGAAKTKASLSMRQDLPHNFFLTPEFLGMSCK